MGANWHLMAITSIDVTMDKLDFGQIVDGESILPAKYTDDFAEIEREEWVRKSSLIGDTEKITLRYSLSEENIGQMKPFLSDIYTNLKSSGICDVEDIDLFLQEGFESLRINQESLVNIDNSLKLLKNNFYLRYESVPDMVVYTGWPEGLKSRNRTYSLCGFIFLSSMMKMQEDPQTGIVYTKMKDELTEMFKGTYCAAKYIAVMGF